MNLDAPSILRMHDAANSHWHQLGSFALPSDPFATLVLAHHRANYDLWHQEDDARSPHAPDSTIAAVKHAIDRLNQQRNDLAEQIDTLLLQLAGTQNASAPLHSESPGLIIDRLSILALKIYHTAEESHRASATEEHRIRSRAREDTLIEQRTDLAACLTLLWTEIHEGKRRFKLYRQLKMYNDPELNPVLRNATVKK